MKSDPITMYNDAVERLAFHKKALLEDKEDGAPAYVINDRQRLIMNAMVEVSLYRPA